MFGRKNFFLSQANAYNRELFFFKSKQTQNFRFAQKLDKIATFYSNAGYCEDSTEYIFLGLKMPL